MAGYRVPSPPDGLLNLFDPDGTLASQLEHQTCGSQQEGQHFGQHIDENKSVQHFLQALALSV